MIYTVVLNKKILKNVEHYQFFDKCFEDVANEFEIIDCVLSIDPDCDYLIIRSELCKPLCVNIGKHNESDFIDKLKKSLIVEIEDAK